MPKKSQESNSCEPAGFARADVGFWMRPPRCKSAIVTKDGTTQLGGQRFRCSRCGRHFTRRSSSAVSGRAFPDDIMALAVRWYLRYRLSYAEVSEWLAERGVIVDQSTIYRCAQRFLTLFGEVARKDRDPVGPDWRVDETCARIRGPLNAVRRRRKPRMENGRCGTVHVPRVRLTCRWWGHSWLPLNSVLGMAAKRRSAGCWLSGTKSDHTSAGQRAGRILDVALGDCVVPLTMTAKLDGGTAPCRAG